MQSNPYVKLTGNRSGHPQGTYGIEVEAERMNLAAMGLMMERIPPDNALLCAMMPHWQATTDGSLRHNGVEWISAPINRVAAEQALGLLYDAMDEGLFRPSVRTGIHVHNNATYMTAEQFVQALRAYAVLEPLLFRFVGVEREQNIYCVPLYRAVNEQRLWQQIAHLMHGDLGNRQTASRLFSLIRECCKYSALNISTFVRLGTFEFRHAPTFERRTDAINWLRLVAEVSNFVLPYDATEDSLLPAKEWASVLVPGLDWDEYLREVRERGLLGFANSLRPFTYKVAEWGKPAGLAFDRQPMPPRPAPPPRPRRAPPPMATSISLDELMRARDMFAAQPMQWANEPTPADFGEQDNEETN